jgi:hypothetical protein
VGQIDGAAIRFDADFRVVIYSPLYRDHYLHFNLSAGHPRGANVRLPSIAGGYRLDSDRTKATL